MAENIVLDRDITEKSKNTACKIDNKDLRKRTYALNLAANAAAQYLESKGFSVNTESSLYKIPAFAQNLELADIYVNKARLDVRVTFDEKTFYIPKIQEKYDAEPYAYLITKLGSDLENVEILGFIPANEIEKQKSANEYYCYESSLLKPVSELNNFLENVKIKAVVPTPEEIEKTQELAVAFVDGELSESEKVYFIKNVVRFDVCREILSNMSKFDNVANQISQYQDLLNDSTLSVLSGNEKEVEEAFIANIATVENAEENLELSEETTDFEEIEPVLTEATEITDVVAETVAAEEFLTEEISLEASVAAVEAVAPIEALSLEEFSESPVESAVEENTTEDIIKPMSVLSLEEEIAEIDSQIDSVSESSLNIGQSDMISDELFDVDNELSLEQSTETEVDTVVESNDIKEETELENLEVEHLELDSHEDDAVAIVEHDELESLIEEHDEVKEDILAIEENIENDEISDLSAENELDILTEETEKTEEPVELAELAESVESVESIEVVEQEIADENDNMLLNEVADLLDEEVQMIEEEKEVVSEENENELSFDFENTENDIEDIENLPVQETSENVDISNIDELSDISDSDVEEVIDVQTEENIDTEEIDNNSNEQIQKLLDDDLYDILTNNDDVQESPIQPVEATVEQTPVVDNVEEESNFDAFKDNSIQQEIPKNIHQTNYSTNTQESDTIETLFETEEQQLQGENKQFELAQEPVSAKTMSATKNIVIIGAILLCLAGGSVAAWFMNQSKDNNNVDAANQDKEMFDLNNTAAKTDRDEPALSQDINKSMTNSFSDKPAAITITKLSWQVSEKLASEASVKEYLQTAGKNIQINLQNDLANSADINFNNSIKVSFEIAPDNTMKGMQVLESSGSDQVDEIVMRSIKNTLKFISVPKLANFNSDFFLTLLINF